MATVPILGALPQFHYFQCALLRPLLLVYGPEAAAVMGRIVAGGQLQYFVTALRSQKFTTWSVSPVFQLVGEVDTELATNLRRAVIWYEEATVWLARENERELPRFIFLAMRAKTKPKTLHKGGHDDDDVFDQWLEAQSLSKLEDVPSWWAPGSRMHSLWRLGTELQRAGYTFHEVLKASTRSMVLRCTRISDGVNCVAKVFRDVPTEPLRCLHAVEELHARHGLPAGTLVMRVLEEVPTRLGHVLMLSALPPVCTSARLGASVGAAVVSRVAALLRALHDSGVYHGDVHAGNVSYDAASGSVGFVDFDSARLVCPTDRDVCSELRERDLKGLGLLAVHLGVRSSC